MGVQFRSDFLHSAPLTTAEGIEKYLTLRMIRGIGSVYVKRLVGAFGEARFNVIRQHLRRLQEVEGIGSERAASIVATWADQTAIRVIMTFLHAHGIGKQQVDVCKGRT